MTSVSVVIPCYNAESWLRETLASVYIQDGVDFEVIVVDDGSTDESAEIIAREFPTVTLIRTPNSGPSRARNVGSAAAQGRYIQYLDADDLLAPGKLARQIQVIEETGADVAYGDWQRIAPQSDNRFVVSENIERQIEGDLEIALFTYFWCPPAVYLFRRALVDRIGGWNERLPVIQDARFALDCALHGGQFVYCPGVMAQYRVHSFGSVSTRSRSAFYRDCYQNAVEVESWWRSIGEITVKQRKALLDVYANAAYEGFDVDYSLFKDGYCAAKRVSNGRVPAYLWRLAFATKIFGHGRAHKLVGCARHVLALARRLQHSIRSQ